MFDQQHGEPLPDEAANELGEFSRFRFVEARRRLVQDQELRTRGQCARDLEILARAMERLAASSAAHSDRCVRSRASRVSSLIRRDRVRRPGINASHGECPHAANAPIETLSKTVMLGRMRKF